MWVNISYFLGYPISTVSLSISWLYLPDQVHRNGHVHAKAGLLTTSQGMGQQVSQQANSYKLKSARYKTPKPLHMPLAPPLNSISLLTPTSPPLNCSRATPTPKLDTQEDTCGLYSKKPHHPPQTSQSRHIKRATRKSLLPKGALTIFIARASQPAG